MAVIDKGATAAQADVVQPTGATVGAMVQVTPGHNAAGAEVAGGSGNAPAMFSENDPGVHTGARLVASPETDLDYRLRVGTDSILDTETFNYAAQNTGKHAYVTSTMTAAWAAIGLTLNALNVATTNIGTRLKSWAEFPIAGACELYIETIAQFSLSTIPTNVLIQMGAFRESGATPFTPTDGVYFLFNSAGVFGVANNNASPTQVALAFTWSPNVAYKFAISLSEAAVQFWIDDQLYGTIPRQAGLGQPVLSTSLPWAVSQAHVGAAGAAIQTVIRDYTVSLGGLDLSTSLGEQGNRALGSHQGLSGGAMGSLASYANSAAPTAGAGVNTSGIVATLGGQVGLNAGVTANTDLILCAYPVPAGSVLVQGRRLRLRGVRVASVNTVAAVGTTPTVIALSLFFGATGASLATADAIAAKAPRREALGFQSWLLADLVGQPAREGPISMTFLEPIFVNPGEFVGVAAKFIVGTATATEIFQFHITFDYSWE